MKARTTILGRALVLAPAILLLGVALGAQQAPRSGAPAWTAPRTADGQPDLQGVWANDVITPVQRPEQLKDRPTLTEAEVASLRAKVAELFTGGQDAAFSDSLFIAAISDAKEFRSSDKATGNYNHFWLSERTFDNRTSLIFDPPDGRIPAFTPDGQKRTDATAARRKEHPADGPEDRGLSERCISFGVPNLLAGYNSNVQIFQSRDYVVVVHENIHDARLIPLDGRPHVSSSISSWRGDSRGRWEGDTLVVETANFVKHAYQGATEQLRLTERFTRSAEDTLQYEFTVEDPQTWTRPWSGMIPYQKRDARIYEYACHEGNYGMEGILSGHRAQEAAAQHVH